MQVIFKIIKYTGISIVILCIILIVYRFWFVVNFHGDGYSNSETYIIRVPHKTLLDDISQFKKNNSGYILKINNQEGRKEIWDDKKDEYRPNFYHVYFYFQDIDLGISCVLDSISNEKSYLGLYVVSQGPRFSTWQGINTKEIPKKENKMIKKEFEAEILDKICNGKWKRKRWYNW